MAEALMVDTQLILKHINKYDKRTGSSFLLNWDIKEFPNLVLFEDGRLFTWAVRTDCIEIGPSTAKLDVMLPMCDEMAKAIGLTKVRAFALVSPKVIHRIADCKIISEYWDGEVNRPCWLLEREVK